MSLNRNLEEFILDPKMSLDWNLKGLMLMSFFMRDWKKKTWTKREENEQREEEERRGRREHAEEEKRRGGREMNFLFLF